MEKISIILIIIGYINMIRNRDKYIIILISIEIVIIGIVVYMINISIEYDDINTFIYTLYILVLSAVEASIGLSILVNSHFQLKKVSVV